MPRGGAGLSSPHSSSPLGSLSQFVSTLPLSGRLLSSSLSALLLSSSHRWPQYGLHSLYFHFLVQLHSPSQRGRPQSSSNARGTLLLLSLSFPVHLLLLLVLPPSMASVGVIVAGPPHLFSGSDCVVAGGLRTAPPHLFLRLVQSSPELLLPLLLDLLLVSLHYPLLLLLLLLELFCLSSPYSPECASACSPR